MAILKKLDLFWRHSDCQIKTKILVQDAVIRSKLLYGLESAELTSSDLKRLDVFQLKGLRKIMKMETTYINRANTNQRVFERTNSAIHIGIGHNKTPKVIKPYSEAIANNKIKWLQDVINLPASACCPHMVRRLLGCQCPLIEQALKLGLNCNTGLFVLLSPGLNRLHDEVYLIDVIFCPAGPWLVGAR